MDLPLLTVFTDASYCARTGAAGWALWAKREDKGTLRHAAQFKGPMPSSLHAEAAALACSAFVVLKLGWAGGDHHVLMQSDCQEVLRRMGKFAHFHADRTEMVEQYMTQMRELKAAVRCLELRWCKAHVINGAEKRNLVHNSVDKAAYDEMQKARKCLSPSQP